MRALSVYPIPRAEYVRRALCTEPRGYNPVLALGTLNTSRIVSFRRRPEPNKVEKMDAGLRRSDEALGLSLRRGDEPLDPGPRIGLGRLRRGDDVEWSFSWSRILRDPPIVV